LPRWSDAPRTVRGDSKRLRPWWQQHRQFEQVLRPQLAREGIHLLDYIDLNQEQRTYLQRYFDEQIFPVLTLLWLTLAIHFPTFLISLNLAVVVKNPETEEEFFARVKVPKVLPDL